MKKLVTAMVALTALVAAPLALAEMKVAVVDINEAIGQTSEAQEFLAQVQEELRPEQEQIREMTAERARIEERVERDGDVLSEQERRRLSEQYERLGSDLQYRTEAYQQTLQRRRSELMRQMGPRVQSALNEMVEDEDYDLVVPAGAVIYARPALDITRRLSERLDAE